VVAIVYISICRQYSERCIRVFQETGLCTWMSVGEYCTCWIRIPVQSSPDLVIVLPIASRLSVTNSLANNVTWKTANQIVHKGFKKIWPSIIGWVSREFHLNFLYDWQREALLPGLLDWTGILIQHVQYSPTLIHVHKPVSWKHSNKTFRILTANTDIHYHHQHYAIMLKYWRNQRA